MKKLLITALFLPAISFCAQRAVVPAQRALYEYAFTLDNAQCFTVGTGSAFFYYDTQEKTGVCRDIAQRRLKAVLTHRHISSITMSRTKENLCIICSCSTQDSTIKLFQIVSGGLRLAKTLTHDKVQEVGQIDNNTIYSRSFEEGTIKIWNAVTGELIHTLHHPSVKVMINLRDIYISRSDDSIRIWDPATGGCIKTIAQPSVRMSLLSSLEPYSISAFNAHENMLHVWNVLTGRKVADVQCPAGTTMAQEEDGSILTFVQGSPLVTIVRYPSQKICGVLNNGNDIAAIDTCCSVRNILFILSTDGTIKIWNTLSKTVLQEIASREPQGSTAKTDNYNGLNFSEDEKYMFYENSRGQTVVFKKVQQSVPVLPVQVVPTRVPEENRALREVHQVAQALAITQGSAARSTAARSEIPQMPQATGLPFIAPQAAVLLARQTGDLRTEIVIGRAIASDVVVPSRLPRPAFRVSAPLQSQAQREELARKQEVARNQQIRPESAPKRRRLESPSDSLVLPAMSNAPIARSRMVSLDRALGSMRGEPAVRAQVLPVAAAPVAQQAVTSNSESESSSRAYPESESEVEIDATFGLEDEK